MKKLLLLTFLVTAITFAQKPIFTSAKVKSATVYFNAAELQQTTSVIFLLEQVKLWLKMLQII